MVASSSPSLLDSVDARAARPAAQGTGRNLGPHPGGGQGSQGGVRFARPSRRARCSLCSHRFADLNSAGVLSHLCDGLVARALCGFGFPCKLCGFCADLRGFAWTHAFLSRWGTKAKCSGQAATETQYSRTDRFCMHLRLRGAKCFVNMFWARFTSRGSISAAHL